MISGVDGDVYACAACCDARRVVRLVDEYRHAHERHAIHKAFGHRANSALCDEHSRLRQHCRVWDEALDNHVRRRDKISRIEGKAERNEGADIQL